MKIYVVVVVCLGLAVLAAAAPQRDLAAELDALEEALGVRELSPDSDPNPDDDDADKRELNTSLLSLIEKGLLEPTDLLGADMNDLSKRARFRVRVRAPRFRVRIRI